MTSALATGPRSRVTDSLLTGSRSASLRAHDEAAANLEHMLTAAGAAVGDWRPHLDELQATAAELEEAADRAYRHLDDMSTWIHDDHGAAT